MVCFEMVSCLCEWMNACVWNFVMMVLMKLWINGCVNVVCSMWVTRRIDFGVRRFVDQGKDKWIHWLHF